MALGDCKLEDGSSPYSIIRDGRTWIVSTPRHPNWNIIGVENHPGSEAGALSEDISGSSYPGA